MTVHRFILAVGLHTPLKKYLNRACLKTEQGTYLGKEEIVSQFAKALTTLAKSGMENSGLTDEEIIEGLNGQTITIEITISDR